MHQSFADTRLRQLMRALVAALATVAVAGCGGKGVVPIEPRFSLDGQPLDGASVSFIRSNGEKGRASFGITDANGIAKMTTFEPNDGVLPGSYSVVVIKAPDNAMTYEVEEVDPNDVDALMKLSSSQGAVPQQRRKRVRTTIPEIYAQPSTTPLTCKVDSDSEAFEFTLSSR
ncbi:MAG: hypothetical protein CMJ58_07860 [Planctomycetaceae bacterium]|nr:hypothetical protein [Planctomycetaceae bacterium]